MVGFSTYHSVSGKGRLWTLVLQSNGADNNGVIRLYFVGKWKGITFDTNLSAAWGTDTLSSVWNAYYTFTSSTTCAPQLSWGFANTSYDDGLQALIHEIDQDAQSGTDTSIVHRAAPESATQARPSLRSYLPNDILVYKFIALCILLVLIIVFGIYVIVRKNTSKPVLPPSSPVVWV